MDVYPIGEVITRDIYLTDLDDSTADWHWQLLLELQKLMERKQKKHDLFLFVYSFSLVRYYLFIHSFNIFFTMAKAP